MRRHRLVPPSSRSVARNGEQFEQGEFTGLRDFAAMPARMTRRRVRDCVAKARARKIRVALGLRRAERVRQDRFQDVKRNVLGHERFANASSKHHPKPAIDDLLVLSHEADQRACIRKISRNAGKIELHVH